MSFWVPSVNIFKLRGLTVKGMWKFSLLITCIQNVQIVSYQQCRTLMTLSYGGILFTSLNSILFLLNSHHHEIIVKELKGRIELNNI